MGRFPPIDTLWARDRPDRRATLRTVEGMSNQLFIVSAAMAVPATPISLAQAGLKEREHLQEWVIAHPEVLGGDVMVVTSEFDQWATDSGSTAKERLDILGLDASGRLVVVELKRSSDRTIHIQAITYAALVSHFTEQTLAAVHADFRTKRGTATTPEEAMGLLRDHVEGELDPAVLAIPRIVLLASTHPAQVVTSVVWLTDLGLNIELRQFQVFQFQGQTAVTFDQVFPVPGVDAQLLSPGHTQVAAAVKKADEQAKAANAVRIIYDGHLIEPGTTLTLHPTVEVTADIRAKVDAWVDENPDWGRATWVADPVSPLRWAVDGKTYRPTTLVRRILKQAADIDRGVRGTSWWQTPDGMDLAATAGLVTTTPSGTTDWAALHDAITVVGPGEWASYGDLGEVIGIHPKPIGGHISHCPNCPPGAHRILTADGAPSSGFHWSDPDDTRACRDVLEEEGLGFDQAGRADQQRRLAVAEIRQRVEAAATS